MTPRYKPPTLKEKGLQQVFHDRKLDYELFLLLDKAGLTDTAIAKALSEDYRKKMGIEIHVLPKTVKRYRGLL